MDQFRVLHKLSWGFFILGSLFLFSSCGEEGSSEGETGPASTRYEITAEVEGLGAQMTRFIGMIGNVNYLVDSAMSDANGRITFSADSTLPGGLYYFVFPDNNYIQFLLEDDQEFVMKTQKSDIIGKMVVEGSLDNELFYKNLNYEADFQSAFQSIDARFNGLPEGPEKEQVGKERDAKLQERKDHIQWFVDNHPNSLFTRFKVAGQNPDLKYPKKPDGTVDTLLQVYYFRNEYWDNTDMGDEALLRTPVISNKLENYITKFTDQQIDSVIKYADIVIDKSKANKEMFKFVANQLAIKYNESQIMGGEAIFVHLIDKYFTDDQAFWSTPEDLAKIRKEANDMRVSLLGKQAQDLRCINLKGEYESLLDLKSKLIVLYIWSYECEHCQERTPVLVDVMKEWRSKGVEVYALCTNQDEAKWREFVNKYKMYDFHNVYDPKYESDYYKKYHIDNTPEVYVLDEDRKIIAKDLHPNQLPVTFRGAL